MIPQEKNEAVTRALRESFGVAEFENIERVAGGHTPSLVYRVVVRGTPYLMKIITRAEDQTRHYTHMRAAAEAGASPHVWHTDIENKISITDFVNAQPLTVSDALVRIPALLRSLHASATFGGAPFNTTCTFLLDPGPGTQGYLQKFRAANIMPQAEAAEFFARLAELAAAIPRDEADMVACHNDVFKPDNFLSDGQRLWLVDWEASFCNDRYADLAVPANLVVTNEADEQVYLTEYFGAPPTEYQRARFHLMQQLAHLFYTMGFLFLGSGGQPVDWTRPVPGFRDFHRRMWAGEVDLMDKDVKLSYGRVHWEQLLRNVQQPRYRESLRIVADR